MKPNPFVTIYQTLFDHFGPQGWWPGESPFEVMVGAVLTQNTNWTNVSRAIDALKSEDLLDVAALSSLDQTVLAALIRPAGYYNLKSRRLKNLLALISSDYHGDIDNLLAEDTWTLRQQLLAVKGIGPETADSILLYAAQRPVFVVDAYTHRILSRHGLIAEEAEYHETQETITDALPGDTRLFNEYHALLVRLGKEFCRKSKPKCDMCPVKNAGLRNVTGEDFRL